MIRKQRRFFGLFLLASGLFAQTEQVLIRARKPYTNLVRSIEQLGGRVTRQYQSFDGLAAEVPQARFDALIAAAGTGNVFKDFAVPLPAPLDARLPRNLARTGDENLIQADSVQALAGADIRNLATAAPNGYLLNGAIINTLPLFAGGNLGQGVTVAVIDSGIRPGFPHISFDGSVVGCEDLVGDALGCSNFGNDGHGTFVAGMISANVLFTFPVGSPIRDAVLAECPACFLNPPVNTQVPMIGTAPSSSIYALRVFGPVGGAPTSRILAAMDRAIVLRRMFDNGQPGGVNIKVCNMSLGGLTLSPGSELQADATAAMINADIVPVIAAGNAGPSSLTVGSPSSAPAAVTVGAASLAHNERILRRLQFGPVLGALYRPFLGAQTAFFSSRGPNSDGRGDPDVSANGFANFGQGFGATGSITFGSGTSYATPSVAGVAALLRNAAPAATARQVRNAIISSANPTVFADGSGVLDRGAGYVDALAAATLLAAGMAPDTLPNPGTPNTNVKVNIEQNTALKVRDGFVQERVVDLKPGQRSDILYRVANNVKQVLVSLSNVTPALPPASQNLLFGDDVLFTIHSAKTSSIGDGDYKVFAFTTGGAFVVNDPEPGIMRVTVNGDWTNAGTISANVSIVSVTDPLPQFTRQGKIVAGQAIAVPVTIPPGTSKAEFRLTWREDWGSYPANDLDLFLIRPNNTVVLNGATASSPESATITSPEAGVWTAVVVGFEINTGDDKYELRIALDGRVQ